ncbi:hypothetical protein SP90_11285 [Halodesulfovibrio spirochaetisodalis]|uniref:Uncharacterized protein n=1 Tax=Halodesulfovibrio spirochaetisodalis TaxID=1560234 RepID=A0A1B7XBE7_9BACT|nr:hypothetical protein SP90_11285 [Halodesulfovibrio spirochaetisodalis]
MHRNRNHDSTGLCYRMYCDEVNKNRIVTKRVKERTLLLSINKNLFNMFTSPATVMIHAEKFNIRVKRKINL